MFNVLNAQRLIEFVKVIEYIYYIYYSLERFIPSSNNPHMNT